MIAENGGRKFATMQFIISPWQEVSREEFFRYVLPLLAAVFGFNVLDCVVFEHIKPRQYGDAVARHWHVIVNYVDPLT